MSQKVLSSEATPGWKSPDTDQEVGRGASALALAGGLKTTPGPNAHPATRRVGRRELRLSALEPASQVGIPPARPRLGPNSTLRTQKGSLNPTPAAPVAQEHT